MTASVDHLLNRTMAVHRRQTSPDHMGGQESDWQMVGTVAARISQPTVSAMADMVAAAQSGARASYAVYLRPDADVQRGDVLVSEDAMMLFVEAVSYPSIRVYLRAESRSFQTDDGTYRA